MHPNDKINKASWNLLEGARDAVVKNVSIAVRDGKIKVESSSLPQLLSLISASINEGYHNGYNVFNRELAAAMKAASVPPATPPSTKKK